MLITQNADIPCLGTERITLYPGADSEFQGEGDRRPLTIVTIADLDWRNGHEYALEGIKLARALEVDLRYTLIGSGPFFEAVGFARYEMGLCDIMEMVPSVSEDIDPFQSTEVFLLGAVAEGAGHALDEALT